MVSSAIAARQPCCNVRDRYSHLKAERQACSRSKRQFLTLAAAATACVTLPLGRRISPVDAGTALWNENWRAKGLIYAAIDEKLPIGQIAELRHSLDIARPLPTANVPATCELDIRKLAAAYLQSSHSKRMG
jgi:hypothetical protein